MFSIYKLKREKHLSFPSKIACKYETNVKTSLQLSDYQSQIKEPYHTEDETP